MGASLLLLWPLVKSSHRPAMLGGKIGQASAKPRRLRQHERGRDLIEPRILPKRIEEWIYAQLQDEPIRLGDHFRQPDKCVFEIAGACVGEKHNARPRHTLRERAFGRVPPVLSAPGFAWPLRTRQWQKPVLAQPRLLFARSAPAWQSIA